jgi:hypothetical protein
MPSAPWPTKPGLQRASNRLRLKPSPGAGKDEGLDGAWRELASRFRRSHAPDIRQWSGGND